MRVLCTSEMQPAMGSEIDAVSGGDVPTVIAFTGGAAASAGAAVGAGVTIATGGAALLVYAAAFGITYWLMS